MLPVVIPQGLFGFIDTRSSQVQPAMASCLPWGPSRSAGLGSCVCPKQPNAAMVVNGQMPLKSAAFAKQRAAGAAAGTVSTAAGNDSERTLQSSNRLKWLTKKLEGAANAAKPQKSSNSRRSSNPKGSNSSRLVPACLGGCFGMQSSVCADSEAMGWQKQDAASEEVAQQDSIPAYMAQSSILGAISKQRSTASSARTSSEDSSRGSSDGGSQVSSSPELSHSVTPDCLGRSTSLASVASLDNSISPKASCPAVTTGLVINMEGPAATVTAAAATAAEAVNSNGMGKESAAPPAAASAGQQQQDEKGARSAQAVVEGLEGQHTQPAGQHEEAAKAAEPTAPHAAAPPAAPAAESHSTARLAQPSEPQVAPAQAAAEAALAPERQPISKFSFGSHSERNLRAYMEDRHICVDYTGHAAFPAAQRAGLFCVFDGHGGHRAAAFLESYLPQQVLAAGPEALAQQPQAVLNQAVQCAEAQLLQSYAAGDTTGAAGSTVCAVLLINDQLHVAHVGDTRAVLARGPTAKALTRDHKPSCSIEAARITSDDPAAHISTDGYLYGELGVARAVGSAHLKADPSKKALIAVPEITTIDLEHQDDFVVVASDGVWDSLTNTEAVSAARRVLADTQSAEAASRALVERAQRCGSSDNISVVTLLLHNRGITVPRSNSRLFRRTASAPSAASATAAAPAAAPAVPAAISE